jgi:hypothetical protein
MLSVFGSAGVDGKPAGSGAAVVAGVNSSGLRRLNKTLYQTERGDPAYHVTSLPNNILLRLSTSIRNHI